jgi:phosphate transport system substrate-binding protein
MSTAPGAIVRKSGISRIIFVISLIIVAVASGLGGYFIPGLFHSSSSTLTLNGAGSTFVYPLISAMDTNYSKINTNILINYQPVGSGTGITDLSNKIVDFGASDAPLTSSQIQGAPNTVTIPDTIGAVVIGYNIPINSTYSIHSGLQLNSTVAAEIFQGNITYWDDSRILVLNRNLPGGVTMPHQQITIVHRSDSSGTTFVFSGYLASSPVWKLGAASKSFNNWPLGAIGANGNPGVASVIQGTKGAVGYVELDYALSASPPIYYAYMYNSAGNTYIQPSLSTTTLAVTSAPTLPTGDNATGWQSVNLLNSSNPGAYPIVTFSYIMVFKELNVYGSAMNLARAQDLLNYLWFMVHDGQNQATPLSYVSLPSNVVANAEASLRLITYNGAQLHS